MSSTREQTVRELKAYRNHLVQCGDEEPVELLDQAIALLGEERGPADWRFRRKTLNDGGWRYAMWPRLPEAVEARPEEWIVEPLYLHPPTPDSEAVERITQELTDLQNHDEMGGTARYLMSVLRGETRTMREMTCADAIIGKEQGDVDL